MDYKLLILPGFFSALLAGGAFGFWYFENSLILKIALVALILISLAWYFWQKDSRWMIIVGLFLTIYNLDNLHFGIGLPLFAIMVVVFGLTVLLSFLWLKKPTNVFYLAFLGFLILEMFLTLSFWPANPLSKSMLATTVFFLFGELTLLKMGNMLSWKEARIPLILSSLIIFGTIMTTQWYGL